MGNDDIVSFKIYLFHKDSEEPEIRRFGLHPLNVTEFALLVERITDVFPVLSGKVFNIFWKDEEGDDIMISSDEELILALKSIKTDLKRFYVKVQTPGNRFVEKENNVEHPGVLCDGCESGLVGFRYKCLVCRDYDLCSDCERANMHAEHPMIRISDPFIFEHLNLRKLTYILHSYVPEIRHHRRRHSHDNGYPDLCKKKKRVDKRESGPETGDESEEGCHFSKHYHKKCKKSNKCWYRNETRSSNEREVSLANCISRAGPYSYLLHEVLNYINPINFPAKQLQNDTNEPTKRFQKYSHISYLQSLGSTIQKLLDPLGVNVDVEVRSEQDEGTKKKESKPEDKREEEGSEKQNETSKTPSSTPSASNFKEVRFETSQMTDMVQKINEITKKLANQTMSNTGNTDNDGWVSFEELKKDSEDSQASKSGETVPTPPPAQTDSEPQTTTPKTSPKSSDAQTLYPNLIPEVPEHVRDAVDKMLSMGFTNEGNWLTYLLEAKNGDIAQALEVLSSQKKN